MTDQGHQAASPPAPPRALRRTALVLIAGVGLTWSGWFFWSRHRPPLPEIDVSNANPSLATAIGRAVDAVRQEPRSGDRWGLLGMILLAHQYNLEAADCFRQAETWAPDDSRWPYYGAQACFKIYPTRAIALLKRAVACDEREPTIRLFLGELQMEQGEWDDAERNLTQVLTDRQYEPWGRLRLAQIALGRGDVQLALTEADRAEAGAVPIKALHVLRAEIEFRMGNAPAAEREREKANALPSLKWPDPHMAKVEALKEEVLPQLARANELSAQGHGRAAIVMLEKIVDANPQSIPARLSLARAYLDQKQWHAAENASRQALSLHPDDAIALNYLGFSLGSQGQLAQAVETYKLSVASNPQNADTHYELGSCYFRLGNKKAALESLKNAVRLRPNLANGWRELGQLLAKEDDGEALLCFRRAVELAPEDELARRLLNDSVKRQKPSHSHDSK